MKGKGLLIVVFLLGCLLIIYNLPAHAQKPPKALTILYSNNLNGEVEPCPT
jgi:hypothetical protein